MSSTPEQSDIPLDFAEPAESPEVDASADADALEAVGAPETADGGDATADAADATADGPLHDERLLDAHDIALAALREITPEATIGAPAGYTLEADGVVSLRFENRLGGYPGWFWTVSVASVADDEPTVLEAELLPGEGALLAPDWVPWALRLAEYQAAQVALAEAAGAADDDEDDLDEVDDLDAADFDEDGSPILHSGDVDGVDIDELDLGGADGDDEDASDDEDDSEDDSDDSEDDEDLDDEDESDEDESDEDESDED